MRRRRRRGRRSGLNSRLVLLLLAVVLVFVALNQGLKPVVASITTNEARIASTEAINRVVEQELLQNGVTYSSFIQIERSAAGEVQTITTDMIRMNQLKASVVQKIQKELGGYSHTDLGIPLGTLFGGELFHGRGPNVPLRLTLSGNVTAEYKSSFSSAGINQTRHQIRLEIHTSIYSFIPGLDTTTDLTTDIPVAETVIVGEVPKFLANMGKTDGDTE